MSKGQRVRVAIACAATAVALQSGAQHRAAPSAPPLTELPFLAERTIELDQLVQRPAGLAWQSTQTDGQRPTQRLWITDVGAGKVFEVNPVTKRFIGHTLTEDVATGPAAFDVKRRRLWVVDQNPMNKTRLIRGFKWPSDGTSALNKVLEPLPFGPAALPHPLDRPTIRGIAVDSSRDSSTQGRIVWICRGGGLCSTIEVYDINSGKTLAQFFPRCEPESITIDPDGRRLWILANNGPDRSMVLVERWLTGKADEPTPQPSVLETRRYLQLPRQFPRATAIAATGDGIWALVEDPQSSKTQATVNVKLHLFPVGSHPVPP